MKLRGIFKKLIYKKDKDYILKDSDFKAEENLYYADVSAKFANAQMLLYLLLLIFVAGSLLIYSDTITYKNLYYFGKDFNMAIDIADSGSDNISYSPDPVQSFTPYKGGIALSGNTGLTVMTASGRVSFSQNHNFSTPKISSSKKYVITYDLDGNSVFLCNSFSKLYSNTYDCKVLKADVCDSGAFAVATASNESKSEIYLYNSAFRLINFIRTNQYVIDLSLSQDGKYLAVLSVKSSDSGYVTELKVYEAGSENTKHEVSYNGAFPLGCKYTDEGALNVILDNAAFSYDKNGKAISNLDLSKGTVATFGMSDSGSVLVFSDSTESLKNRIIVFDRKGKIVYNKDTDFDVSEAAVCGKFIFLKTHSSIVRLNSGNDSHTEIEFDRSDVKMLVYSESCVVMCSSSKAWFVDF